MRLYREVVLLIGTILGATVGTGRGMNQTNVTPKIVPFGVSVLAVVTNKIEAGICLSQRAVFASRAVGALRFVCRLFPAQSLPRCSCN